MEQIAIIGAGISGISLARLLQDKAQVTVFEQKKEIGGLIGCEFVNGYLYHRVGGHVFNSKNQTVLNWFWQFFDKEKEFIKAQRKAKVFYKNDFIDYPIENFLYQFKDESAAKIISELLDHPTQKDAGNFEEFLKQNFGNTLYQLYFKPYNEKIWNTDLSQVPLEWLDGKLPMPNKKEIFLSNILRKEEQNMVHAFFYYPMNGGSQFIIDRLAEGITCIKNAAVKNIVSNKENKLFVEGKGPFDKVVYTGDVRKLPAIIQNVLEPTFEESKLDALISNGTTNILCTCDKNDLSWMYIPEKKFKAHRIIYTGNFAKNNNGAGERSSCTVEFSNEVNLDEAKNEIKELPGNLQYLAYNYEPNSYVIQQNDTRKIIGQYKSRLATKNIYLVGRFAEWEYYNMDKAIEASFLLSEELQDKYAEEN